MKILVALDGSPYSERALDRAADVAAELGASLILCSVVDIAKAAAMTFGESQLVDGYFEALEQDGREVLARAAKRVESRVPSVQTQVLRGNVVDEIVGLARSSGADWIVIGSHGRTGAARLFLGSVAEGVLRHAGIPVMVVPKTPSGVQAAAS